LWRRWSRIVTITGHPSAVRTTHMLFPSTIGIQVTHNARPDALLTLMKYLDAFDTLDCSLYIRCTALGVSLVEVQTSRTTFTLRQRGKEKALIKKDVCFLIRPQSNRLIVPFFLGLVFFLPTLTQCYVPWFVSLVCRAVEQRRADGCRYTVRSRVNRSAEPRQIRITHIFSDRISRTRQPLRKNKESSKIGHGGALQVLSLQQGQQEKRQMASDMCITTTTTLREP
jgi:hypothetical protein